MNLETNRNGNATLPDLAVCSKNSSERNFTVMIDTYTEKRGLQKLSLHPKEGKIAN